MAVSRPTNCAQFLWKCLRACFDLEHTAAATVMTAIGFISAIILAQKETPTWAVIVCVLIGILGTIILACQWYQAFSRLTEEERIFARFQQIFAAYSDGWKRNLKRLLDEGSLDQQQAEHRDAFRHCPFVFWDGGPGRFLLNPSKENLLGKLVKQWEAESGKRAKP
jgi:hypothetical protein